jgi:hypothetical protein
LFGFTGKTNDMMVYKLNDDAAADIIVHTHRDGKREVKAEPDEGVEAFLSRCLTRL